LMVTRSASMVTRSASMVTRSVLLLCFFYFDSFVFLW
jgi:hypothetical protein